MKNPNVFVEFIKYAITSEEKLLSELIDIDWKEYLEYCNRQGVVGLVFCGLERSGLKIPQMTLFEWIGFAENIKQQNVIVDKRISQISRYFENKGYRSIILKGQVNGLMYPQPNYRSPGDIDIWVEGDAVDIIRTVLEACPDAHYSLNHVKMPVFNDVSVEVHYSPSHIINWYKDRALQRYIYIKSDEQFSHKIKLNDSLVGALTDDFNIVFQLLHMYGHFFTTRNNFKQFIDYYYLLKNAEENCKFEEVRSLLQKIGLLRYAKGMMWVMKETLGLGDKYLYVEPDAKVGSLILSESFKFGTYSPNKFKQVLQQYFGNYKLVRYFPFEVLINPIFLLWHQWWKVRMKWKLDKN